MKYIDGSLVESITLSKSEIWLINTLKFDINDILIARKQKKDFAKEWKNNFRKS